MTRPLATALLVLALAGCPKKASQAGVDCAQDGTCPDDLTCFADFRCYPRDADPACTPPCYGAEPHCDKRTLRCVACLVDTDCEPGFVCAPPIMRCQHGCSAEKPLCPEVGTHCDLALGACVGCSTDAECTDASKPRCDETTGVCEPCVAERDDCPAGTFCGGASRHHACEPGCRSQADCVDGGGGSMDCCNHRCVDTADAGDNCGVCGVVCRAGKRCCSGQCADLASDPDNCSACGAVCSRPNAVGARCVSSRCAFTGCESFFGDCDNDMTNGCEANLSYDPNHCSSCTNACAALQHAAPACVLTSCALGPCDPGWGNCDGNAFTGCETALTALPHCGACFNACDAGQSCDAGACQ